MAQIVNILSAKNQNKKYIPLYSVAGHVITKQGKKESFEHIKILNKAIFSYPDSSQLYVARGKERMWLTIYSDALDDFEKAGDLGSNNDSLNLLLGKVHLFLGHRKSALVFLDRYIKVNPDKTAGLFWKAIVYMYHQKSRFHSIKERYLESIPAFTKVLDIDDSHSASLLLRGFAYFYLQDYEKALLDFKKLKDVKPEDHRADLFLGNTYFELGELEKACTYYSILKDSGEKGLNKMVEKSCLK
ncbi:MAG: tetratricopeptide repeat protein [Bacteroidota bacterium]